MKLSTDFSLSEFTRSERAERVGGQILQQQRNPPPEIIAAIKHQVTYLWQPLRSALGVIITMNSGWRCELLNQETPGASTTSQHVLGEAGDGELSESFLRDDKLYVTNARKAIEKSFVVVLPEF